MDNLKDYISQSPYFRKFEVDELLFAEFKCPISDERSDIWWDSNFFAFVISGETMLETATRRYVLKAGECAFAKRGSVVIHTNTKEAFCEFLVFVPDHFIREVMTKHMILKGKAVSKVITDTIIPLPVNSILQAYFQSLLSYFEAETPPDKNLLKLKFEELLILMGTHSNYPALQSYFGSICSTSKPSIAVIMEANFTRPLTVEEYARLCIRSLSTFKLEFKKLFDVSPGKWVQERRLMHAKYLLDNFDQSVQEIAYSSGFSNRSHFSTLFKRRFGYSPTSSHRKASARIAK